MRRVDEQWETFETEGEIQRMGISRLDDTRGQGLRRNGKVSERGCTEERRSKAGYS